MYGKSYESKYEGSLVGSGMHVFAVWDYIITKCRDGTIEINPKLLAFILGGSPKDVESALDFLQQPDLESRSKLEEGRRLVKEGQYQYRVVNWGEYNRIRSEEDRREYNRVKQAEFRAKEKALERIKREKANRRNGLKKSTPGGSAPGEAAYVKAVENGWVDENGEPIKSPE